MLTNLLGRWLKRKCRLPTGYSHGTTRKTTRCRPWLETLEDRTLLATLVWNGMVDSLWSSVTGFAPAYSNWYTIENGTLTIAGATPQYGDDLVFPTDGFNRTSTDDIARLAVSLSFEGSGYSISSQPGVQLFVGDISATNATGTNTLSMPIAAFSSITSANRGTTLNLLGPVTIGAGFPASFVKGDGDTNIQIGASSGLTALSKTGSGSLTVYGADFDNPIELDGGTLQVPAGSNLGNGLLTLNGGTLKAINGPAVLNNPLVIGGDAAFAGEQISCQNQVTLSGNHTLTVNNTTVFNGEITDGGAGFGLEKAGGGTLVLAGANSYAGQTTLDSGTLVVANNAALGTGPLALDGGVIQDDGTDFRVLGNDVILGGDLTFAGANLIFTGTVTVTGTRTITVNTLNLRFHAVNQDVAGRSLTMQGSGKLAIEAANVNDIIVLGGTLTPGGGPDLVHAANVRLTSGATLTAEIDGSTPGVDYDQLNAHGAVNLGGATLAAYLGFAPAPGSTFTIVHSAAGLSGSFAGLPNGAVFALGNSAFRITYTLTDVVLTAGPPATLTWTGTGSDSDWSSRGNWSVTDPGTDSLLPARAPENGDTLVFPPSPIASLSNIDNLVGLSLRAIIFSGSGYGIAATPHADITLSAITTSNATGTNTLDVPVTMAYSGGPGLITSGNSGSLLNITKLTFNIFLVEVAGHGDTTLIINRFPSTNGLEKDGSGTLTLRGTNLAGALTLNAGTLQVSAGSDLGSGPLNLNGGTLQAIGAAVDLANPVVIRGDTTFGGSEPIRFEQPITLLGNYTLTVNNTTTFFETVADGGAGFGFTKAGPGTLLLQHNDTYGGQTTLTDGSLVIGNNGALGSGILVTNGGAIQDDGSLRSIANPVELEADASLGGTAGLHFTGPVVLTGNRTLNVTSLGPVTIDHLSEDVAGRQLIKTGPGRLVLDGSGTFTGGTMLRGGPLEVDDQSAVGTGPLELDSGTLVIGPGIFLVVNPLILGGNITFDSTATNTQFSVVRFLGPTTLTGDRTVTVTANPDITFAGPVTEDIGGRSLAKAGDGKLDIEGDVEYTGMTTVVGGRLDVAAGLHLNRDFTIGRHGILFGPGGGNEWTVADVAVSGGTLFPGNASLPGTLHATGDVTLTPGSTLSVALDGPNGGASDGYDQVQVDGAVDLGGAVLQPTLGFAAVRGQEFTIVHADGGITGTFRGLADGTTFQAGSGQFRIDYTDTDVILTAVPSASTILSLPSLSDSVDGAVVLQADVAGQDGPDLPQGTVTFKDGKVTLGKATLDNTASTQFNWVTPTVAGTHRITAVYSGGGQFAPSTSQVLPVQLKPSQTMLTLSPASVNQGDDVSLTAVVSAQGLVLSGGPSVVFMDGANVLGSAPVQNGGVATLHIISTSLTAGTHHIQAVFKGQLSGTLVNGRSGMLAVLHSVSHAGALTVHAAATATTLVALTSDGNLLTFNSATPSTFIDPVPITFPGLPGGDQLQGIAFDPQGQLYGVSFHHVYTLSPATNGTEAATLVPDSPDLGLFQEQGRLAVSFDPAHRELRVIDDIGNNELIDPATGNVTRSTAAPLQFPAGDDNFGAGATLFGTGCTNQFATPPFTTTLYGVAQTVGGLDSFALITIDDIPSDPNDLTPDLHTVSSMGFTEAFTVGGAGNTGYAVGNINSTPGTSLLTVDLTTHTETLVGQIGSPGQIGTAAIFSLVVMPETSAQHPAAAASHSTRHVAAARRRFGGAPSGGARGPISSR